MLKRLSVVMMLILFAGTSQAGQLLDTYYPKFEVCIQRLGHKIEVKDQTYTVTMNYKALLNYMEELTPKDLQVIASIAMEWNWGTEFPTLAEVRKKGGTRKLAKAIQTAQARAILTAAESILMKDKVWL